MNRLLEWVLVGDRWRTFCRCSKETFAETVVAILDDRDITFHVTDEEASNTERLVYGSESRVIRITITDPFEADVTVLSVTADPVARAALAFLSRSETRDQATAGVCLVQVSPVTRETTGGLARIMTELGGRLEYDPWELAGHPQFRFAFLQRYKIRAKWRYWYQKDVTSEAPSGT
ncbi:hypothetical protein [Natrinema longum]|uniref:hypothetical protein n=1 Tax=Natrinema longum TaxID=370324 RepID=UPI001CCC60F3|nr:hypothetical protein [Natrinema longum]MBZ6496808.1 hypothetical protein [Natrinema longum]